ncbi:M48 metallopeptidase family protein [Thermodesulfovibrio sp. TK110]
MISPDLFKEDVWRLAKEIGVKPKEIHIRKMKRKLASCSSKGRLTFDITLLNETKEVRYKAILHELLHLKYPNHGKMFTIVLKTYLERSLSKRDKN